MQSSILTRISISTFVHNSILTSNFSGKNSFTAILFWRLELLLDLIIFTKCLRPLEQFWRENGVKVVLYLDDRFGMNKDVSSCYEDAQFVKESLIEAGLFINEEKSVFNPVTKLEWLGIFWNSTEFTLSIPERRV